MLASTDLTAVREVRSQGGLLTRPNHLLEGHLLEGLLEGHKRLAADTKDTAPTMAVAHPTTSRVSAKKARFTCSPTKKMKKLRSVNKPCSVHTKFEK